MYLTKSLTQYIISLTFLKLMYMLENFSKKFESVFRVFFLFWVSFWFIINLVDLGITYTGYQNFSDSQLIGWLFKIFGQVITIVIGIFLVFLMSGVPKKITNNQPITNISYITALAVCYYLVANILNIGTILILQPDNAFRNIVFQLGWLLPSIIILVLHIFYTLNLSAFNSELNKNKLQ